MLILRFDLDEGARAAIIGRIKEIVATDDGTIDRIDEWGKKRFAYEIDRMTEGFYFVFYLHAEPKTLDELARVLRITDGVIRFMPIRHDETPVARKEANAVPQEATAKE